MLVVGVYSEESISTVTYANRGLTRVSTHTDTTGRRLEVWYLFGPLAGANSVVVTASSSGDIQAIATGVLNAGAIEPAVTNAQGTGTAPAVSVPSGSSDLLLDFVGLYLNAGVQAYEPDEPQTKLAAGRVNDQRFGASFDLGLSPSVSMSWTLTDAMDWNITGVRVVGANPDSTQPLLDAATHASVSSGSSLSWSHTTTSAPDRMLVVGVYGQQSVTSVTYAGHTLIKRSSTNDAGSRNLQVWYLPNPMPGTGTVSVTWSSSGDKQATAVTYSNAANLTPEVATANGSGTTASVTANATSNAVVLDFVGAGTSSNKTITESTGQIPLTDFKVNSQYMGASQKEGASPSVGMEWTISASMNWIHAGVTLEGAPDAGLQPIVDTTSNAKGSTASLVWDHVVTSAPNRLLVVAVYADSTALGSTPTVTYAGQNLTRISNTSDGGSRRLQVWYLLNPASGAGTITATLSSSTNVQATAITYYNAANDIPGISTNSGSSTSPSVTVAATGAHLITDFVGSASSSNKTLTAGAGQAEQSNFNQSSQYMGSSIESGATSVEMSWTISSSMNWAIAGLKVLPAGSAGAHPIAYNSPTGNYDSLVRNTDQTYTLTTKSQVVISFNALGRLTSFVDRNGNTTTVAYDGSGYLASVTDESARTLTFAVDGSGRITSVTDPLSRVVSYSYTGSDLTGVTDVMSGSTTYTYDGGGKHLLVTNLNPAGNADFLNTYDVANWPYPGLPDTFLRPRRPDSHQVL